LDDAAEIGVKGVSFVSDGESTLSPHFKMAVTHGKANGLDMAVGTNGYALKPSELEEILSCLTYLRFNISAAHPKRYSEIMGVPMSRWNRVIGVIEQSVEVKQRLKLPVTIGLQMVLLPSFADQVMPLARMGKELGVDYTIIKHCSDDEFHALGVDYSKYKDLDALLHQAESLSTETYQVAVKWSKIMSGGKRKYTKCFGPAFIMQFSGSGLVAPCGMLFNERYRDKFHIGNIGETSFIKIWQSDRYWEVLERLHSPEFNPQTMCGSLCLQHKVNEFLWDCVNYSSRGFRIIPSSPAGAPPPHLSFI
jgi:MoaA/NifB/PqqE/SkfB family radical SAM enzyme